jgi:hypothetical protein
MTDKKVLWIRILIAIATFVALTGTIISYWHKRFGPEYLYPGPIYTVLYILAFFTLANGVSYLAEILKKERKYLKILTGIISAMIFIFTLIPQDQETSSLIGWTILIGLSGSSILISILSVLEWAQIKKRFKWFFPFLFAFNSGIYCFLIYTMIFRVYTSSESGILLIGYGAIIFLISMIVNLIAVSSLKNKIRGNQ